MIYSLKNNETIVPHDRNVCVLFHGSITISVAGNTKAIGSKHFFFFDTSFEIVAASPFLEGFIIGLDAEFLKNFPDITSASQEMAPFKTVPIKKIDSKKSQIKAMLDADANRRLSESYSHILWSELIREYQDQGQTLSTIGQFSALIDQHIEHNYCAGTYAEMMGVPLKKLIKEVKKSENKTPCNFITEKVIEKAKYKLTHTDDTSQMIAYQLGFDDPYYFIKYFKKNTSVTPTQFRAQFPIS
ncbi:helix-turn-helix domain-containing protein [Spongiimicrobium salis]|uniref:helix-turn-helix domain-containing protein n=1 Tax=Spongiimicrobium salis TaxID=1667022 RepID=UPI00374DD044